MHLGLLSSVSKTISVTPDNDNDLPAGFKSRAISVQGAGTISYINEDGVTSSVTLSIVGMFYPINAKRIRATGTTATGIEAHA